MHAEPTRPLSISAAVRADTGHDGERLSIAIVPLPRLTEPRPLGV
ncbi:hypothetical protein [Burkholderia cenocepacia]|nr:hypothetical protein [Burkholderia cenocepacia]